MSRRDTIIIAVLLNTGILAILFMMAANPDDDRVSETFNVNDSFVEAKQAASTNEVSQPITVVSSGDEVETVLKDFAATLQSETLAKQHFPNNTSQESVAIGQQVYQTQSASSQKAKQQSEASDRSVDITVKRGDSLSKIAVANNTTVGAIKKANHLSNDNLKIGQVLHIPQQGTVSASEPTSVKMASYNDNKNEFYTLQSGDNPWKIAKKFQLSVNELLRMNNLDEAKARNLKPGDRIRVQ